MIDAVFTWVDGKDQQLNNIREKYISTAKDVRVGGMSQTRYADNNEIYYSIHLLRKNCSWINRIFLVTDNQVPAWLTPDKAYELNVQVVDHKEIFKGYEHCLPTFNSASIETMLFNIKGCSKNVVYLNDDFFILRPLSIGDFFTSKGVVLRGRWDLNAGLLKKIVNRIGFIGPPGYIAFRGGYSNFKRRFRVFRRSHAPIPLFLDEMRDVFVSYPVLTKHIEYKFRATDQIQPMDLFINREVLKNRSKIGPSDWRYINCEGSSYKSVNDRIAEIKKDPKAKMLCIQSLDCAPGCVADRIEQFLEDSLMIQ